VGRSGTAVPEKAECVAAQWDTRFGPSWGVGQVRCVRRILTVIVAVVVASAGVVLTASTAPGATRSCAAATPLAQRPILRRGDTGSCVVVAQRALLAKGYSVGTAGVDGTFGPATYRATTAVQREYGLSVDGVIGALTWSRLATGRSYDRGRGPNETTRVVLTFDDCPRTAAAFRAMARAAASADIGLVFAPTGDCLQKYRAQGVDLAAFARSSGQYVINHTVSHPDLTTISYATVLTQLSAPGVVTNVGRPPGGATDATVAMAYTAKGMRQWTWTIDTRDWTGKTSAQVVSYVVASTRAGSTVLMHMGWNAFTPTALNQIRTGLADRGLRLCTAHHGTTPTRLPRSLPCTS